MLAFRILFTVLVAACCVVIGMNVHLCAADFHADILPVLQSHCVRCHGPELQESNLRLDTLSIDLMTDRVATETWNQVLNVLDTAEMPPEKELQLSDEQHRSMTNWIELSIKEAINARSKTDGRSIIRRLNRIEYQNTMRDLLGLDMNYVRDLPPDAVSADGFQNDASSLQMSSLQLEYYLNTARQALDRVIVSGKQPKTFNHMFTETKIDTWLGDGQRSNRLGRQQEFLAKIVDEYPDEGDFLVRVKLSAELKPNIGFPLLEVSVGYQPDTEILLDSCDIIEVTTAGPETFEFRGRLENFPLPVRGQGKFPGLVIRVRNVYDNQSPKTPGQKNDKGQMSYVDEPSLPTFTIESVEFYGNAYDHWPPARHREILLEREGIDHESIIYVTEIVSRFMSRAFRCEAEEADVARMVAFYESIRPEFPTFEETIRETLAMVLIQPQFLYRLEPSGDEKRPVTDIELASRLSYFLWSTMPDPALLAVAKSGVLHQSDRLTAEVDRMLLDPRSSQLIEHFTDQWLGLDMINNVAVSQDRYRGFDDTIKPHMCGETRALFSELLHQNLSAINFISSDFTMLNESLARYYGIDGVFGQSFRRVTLKPEEHRGGLLGHASLLLINSTGAESHPIRRAVWIRDRLLNDPPSPPPPNVPSLEEANPEFHKFSLRKQLELHRTKESCNRCHRNIDPWGIALENFDAVGKWRDEIEATDTLPGGHEVAGIDGLKNYLMSERKEDLATSLVARLLTYALGRRLELSDEAAVETIVTQAAADDYRLKGIIHKIIASESFQTK